MPFGFLAPKDLMTLLSNLLALIVPDEDYSRKWSFTVLLYTFATIQTILSTIQSKKVKKTYIT
jgi:hypothetical protein